MVNCVYFFLFRMVIFVIVALVIMPMEPLMAVPRVVPLGSTNVEESLEKPSS